MSRFRLRQSNDGYTSVPHDDSDFSDAQFEVPPLKIPWNTLCLAAFLFVVGTSLLIVGSLIATGHIDMPPYTDRPWFIIALGGSLFLPGAFQLRFAYCAYKKYPGYSFADLPDLNIFFT